MAAKRKAYTKLQCDVCKHINYFAHKSKTAEEKLELKKLCAHCKKHTLHKETKK